MNDNHKLAITDNVLVEDKMVFKKLIGKMYSYVTNEKRISFFRKLDGLIRLYGGDVYIKTLGQLKYHLRFRAGKIDLSTIQNNLPNFCIDFEQENNNDFSPLVSIVIKNCNDIDLIRKKLNCIYSQTYPNYEIILLMPDSCLLDKNVFYSFTSKYTHIRAVIVDDCKCSDTFAHWNKGFAAANGELIWFTNAADECECTFIEKMVNLFHYSSVMLAFSKSMFSSKEGTFCNTENQMENLCNLHQVCSFYITAHDFISNKIGLNDF